MRIIAYALIALLVAGCTTVDLKGPNGSEMSSKYMGNGELGFRSGAACTPAVPSPASPIPAAAPAPAPMMMTQRQVCDANGGNCHMMLMQERFGADATPQCDVEVATVRGTDTTTFFAMLLAGAAAAIIGLK